LLELSDVQKAAGVLNGVVNRTPVLTSRTLDERAGGRVLLKCENYQRTGSFKFRGAYNKILSIPETERRKGVCAVSSGNHAQAVALAAKLVDIPAAILMPEDAPKAKLEATIGYGADVVLYNRYQTPQNEAGRKFRDETGLVFVSSHDDPAISAGAGSAVLELIDEAGAADLLLAPIGGGGGMAGYATVGKALNPKMKVIGAEPSTSGIAKKSLDSGERITIDVPRTIADGQQLTVLGEFPFAVMRDRVDDVIGLEDQELIDAMAFLFDRLKIVAEPSGAMGVAALFKLGGLQGRSAGVIVSGGNVGAKRFSALVRR
jgi:threonine dehydratase